MKTSCWTTADQAKEILPRPNPLIKIFSEEAVIEFEARTAVVQLKSEA